MRSGFFILFFFYIFYYTTNCSTDIATGNTKVVYFHQLPFINSFNIQKLFHDQNMVENCWLDGTQTGVEATTLPIASQPLLTKKLDIHINCCIHSKNIHEFFNDQNMCLGRWEIPNVKFLYYFFWHCLTPISHSTNPHPMNREKSGIIMLHYSMICVIGLVIFDYK